MISAGIIYVFLPFLIDYTSYDAPVQEKYAVGARYFLMFAAG